MADRDMDPEQAGTGMSMSKSMSTNDELWRDFAVTGSVADYLRYACGQRREED